MMADYFPECFTDKEFVDFNQNEIKPESANKIKETVPYTAEELELQKLMADPFAFRIGLVQRRPTQCELSAQLFQATFHGFVECSHALLEHGADPDVTHPHKVAGTGLCIACSRGHSEVVLTLCEHGANINLQDPSNGYTALHYAAENGQTFCLEMLLQRNCDISIRNHQRETAYDLLMKQQHCSSGGISVIQKSVDILNAYKSRLKVPFRENALHTSCEAGDVSATQRHLLNKAIDVNEVRSSDNATPLMVAVKKQNISLVKVLLTSRNININISCDGKTGMHWAILKRNLVCVLLLLKAGFRLNSKQLQSFETSPLVLAIEIGEKSIVEALCVFGADVCQFYPCEFQTGCDLLGISPLIMAVYVGEKSIIHTLVKLGADLKTCVDFENVLVEAHKNKRFKLMNELACYFMGVPDLEGHTLLTQAVELLDMEMINMLLNAGVDPNTTNVHHLNSLAIACMKKNHSVVNLLLKFGAQPNKFDVPIPKKKNFPWDPPIYHSPLIISCIHGDGAIVKTLLKCGADPSLPEGRFDKTPLMLSIAYFRDPVIVRELILAGAEIPSFFGGGSPVRDAIERRNVAALKVLLNSNCELSNPGENVILDGYHLKSISDTSITSYSSETLKVLLFACRYYLYRRVVLQKMDVVAFGESIFKQREPVKNREVIVNVEDSLALLEDMRRRVFTLQEQSVRMIRDCLPERLILSGDLRGVPCPKNLTNLIVFSEEALQYFSSSKIV